MISQHQAASSREWILHSGPSKTGSTSIQAWMAINFDALSAQDVYVPRKGWLGNHRLIAEALINGNERFIRDLREEVTRAGSSRVLVSSEELHQELMLKPSSLWNLGLLDPMDRLQVIEFVRPLLEWLLSLWGQSLKTREGISLNEGLRLFYRDRWTRPSEVARALDRENQKQGRHGRFQVTFVPVDPDAVSNIAQVLGIRQSTTNNSSRRRNEGLSAWDALYLWETRCLAPRGLRDKQGFEVAPRPETKAGRIAAHLPLISLLEASDFDWFEEACEEWIRDELSTLIKLSPSLSATFDLIASRSRHALRWRSKAAAHKGLLADAVGEIRQRFADSQSPSHLENLTWAPPHPPARTCENVSPTVFENIMVLPYQRLFSPTIGDLEGGPCFPDFEACQYERQMRMGNAMDIPVKHHGGPTPKLVGQFIWAGPVVGHFGHQVSEFMHRIAPALAVYPHARILMATRSQSADTTSAVNSHWLYRDVEQLPSFVLQILTWMGVSRERVEMITQPTLIEQLVVAPQGQQLGVPAAGWYLDLLDKKPQVVRSAWRGPTFVSRAGVDFGRFAGESYIEACLEQAGFNVLRPEELPVARQLENYLVSEHLVFSEGSAIHALGLLGRGLGRVSVIERRSGFKETWCAELEGRSAKSEFLNAVGRIFPGNGFQSSITYLDPDQLVASLAEVDIRIGSSLRLKDYKAVAARDLSAYARTLSNPKVDLGLSQSEGLTLKTEIMEFVQSELDE